MDSEPELSLPSYPFGFEGDEADFGKPKRQTPSTQPASPVALSDLEPIGLNSWASDSAAGDLTPSVFDAANSGGGLNYDPQVNFLNGNVSSSLTPNPGFVIGGQDTFTQPLTVHDSNVGFENFQHEDFNPVLNSSAVGFSPLGFDTAGPSSFQSDGSQEAWDKPAAQNDFATGFSWDQSMNETLFNPTFRPLHLDDGFVDNDFEMSMPWSPDTIMVGDFQGDVGSNVVASSNPWLDGNVSFGPALSSLSMNEFNLSPTASTSAPAVAASTPNTRIPCTNPTCTRTFKRHFERIRHEASVHRTNRQRYLCPITGCSKSHGKGYTRSDKVTEHLWKKHANLGYMKS